MGMRERDEWEWEREKERVWDDFFEREINKLYSSLNQRTWKILQVNYAISSLYMCGWMSSLCVLLTSSSASAFFFKIWRRHAGRTLIQSQLVQLINKIISSISENVTQWKIQESFERNIKRSKISFAYISLEEWCARSHWASNREWYSLDD